MSWQGIEKNALGVSGPGHTNLEETRLFFEEGFVVVGLVDTFGGVVVIKPTSMELSSMDLDAENYKLNVKIIYHACKGGIVKSNSKAA